AADLTEGRQKAFGPRVKSRLCDGCTVPEVDGERSVRAVDVHVPFRPAHAHQFPQKRAAEIIAFRQWSYSIRGIAVFGHADVLDDARGKNDIEIPVGERGTHRVGYNQPFSMFALLPLPFAKSREIQSPCVVSIVDESVDPDSISGAAVEDRLRSMTNKKRFVELPDPADGAREFLFQAADGIGRELAGPGERVVVVALAEVRRRAVR